MTVTIHIDDETLDRILEFLLQVFEPVKNTPNRRAQILLRHKYPVTIQDFEEYVYKYNQNKFTRRMWRNKLGIIFTDKHVMYERDCPHSRVRAYLREGQAFCRWCGALLEPSKQQQKQMEVTA